MTLSGGENRRERYVANGEKENGWERKIGYSRLSMLIETRMFLIDQSLPSKFDRCLNTRSSTYPLPRRQVTRVQVIIKLGMMFGSSTTFLRLTFKGKLRKTKS